LKYDTACNENTWAAEPRDRPRRQLTPLLQVRALRGRCMASDLYLRSGSGAISYLHCWEHKQIGRPFCACMAENASSL